MVLFRACGPKLLGNDEEYYILFWETLYFYGNVIFFCQNRPPSGFIPIKQPQL